MLQPRRLPLLLVAAAILAALPARAGCLHEAYTIEAERTRSAEVVLATVISEQPAPAVDDPAAPGGVKYTVTILESYLGPRKPRVDVYSDNASGRFLMETGKSYLLFLDDAHGRLTVDRCGHSGPVSEKEPVIQALGKLAKAGPAPLSR